MENIWEDIKEAGSAYLELNFKGYENKTRVDLPENICPNEVSGEIPHKRKYDEIKKEIAKENQLEFGKNSVQEITRQYIDAVLEYLSRLRHKPDLVKETDSQPVENENNIQSTTTPVEKPMR